jgi:hypothetical protein
MPLPGRLPLLALALLACAGPRPPVDLDRFRGVYTTHFEGIPNRAAVCAVVTNRGAGRVDWVRLRLESHSRLGDEPGRWVSYWIWRGRLDPGRSVALQLEDPPMADQIRLDLRSAGPGTPRVSGRPVRPIRDCSETALRVRLLGPGDQALSVVRRNEGSRDKVLVAGQPD